MCVVTNHNLLHIPEDINRFSSTDNFWCFPFERAVKQYTLWSSNCKQIEEVSARAEFLKANHLGDSQKSASDTVNADLSRVGSDIKCIVSN